MHSDNTSSAPVMFCHDGTTIFYPTGPGRVHMIAIAALADCDGSDEDFSDSTARGDVRDFAVGAHGGSAFIGSDIGVVPDGWPCEIDGVSYANYVQRSDDFHDCLEQWADWCDRDAARLDSLDGPAPDADAAGILERLRELADKSRSLPERVGFVLGDDFYEVNTPEEAAARWYADTGETVDASEFKRVIMPTAEVVAAITEGQAGVAA